ncbi:MAG: cation:proton antiporter [Bacteroidaceae bacterium]|nr:cation:proton antiporter [Bacteroidaceae bacterium]
MEELPHLIIDLAYILIVAGGVTIIFKKLRQPLVLGYIVAGFLAGPHMPYTPSIMDSTSISDWSQIGVIFLMFTLGLEFSFKRIIKMGWQPIIAALLVMTCMISVGSEVGWLFGWSDMDRLFLGGMLAMSSTTIIYKAFDDSGVRLQPFASKVLSVLILEDILGILLMVILSALAVSRKFEGVELLNSLLNLGFFLLLWFLVGVFLIPIILRRYKKYINTETLLIVSVGLCFLMVVIASSVGYSPAFGAFMMGSIMAETTDSERISKSISSLKDFFGAIFFVSVGMLVDPNIIMEYWLPIVAITFAVILGQMTLGSLSFLISGNDLKDSLRCGFSLVQIGEFAFIIASLGETLGVTSKFIYPVVVAVSIITTFFTPYIIKFADPFYNRIEKFIPKTISDKKFSALRRRRSQIIRKLNLGNAWKSLLRGVFMYSIIYITLCSAIMGASYSSLLPVSRQICGHWYGNMVCGVITILLLSPFIRPIVIKKNHSEEAKFLLHFNKFHRLMVRILLLLKFCLGTFVVYYIINFLSPLWWFWHVLISILVTLGIVYNRRIKLISIRIERTFRRNLRSREQTAKYPSYGRKLKGRDLQIARFTVPGNTKWGGKTLMQLNFGRTEHIHIAAITRGLQRINIPGGNSRIYPGDIIEIVSDQEGLRSFQEKMMHDIYMIEESNALRNTLSIIQVGISNVSPLCGKTLVDIDFRSRYNCMVVGIEDEKGNLQVTEAQRKFQAGERIWVVGEEADLAMLRMGI